MNLPFLRKPKPVRAAPPVQFYGLGLNVRASAYRQNDQLVAGAMAVVNDPRFQQMLEVIRNEDPARFPLNAGTPLQDRAIHQAMSEGYSLAIEILLSLARQYKQQEMPEETFQVDIQHKE